MRAPIAAFVVLALCQTGPGQDEKPTQENVEVNLITPPPKGVVVFGLTGKDLDDYTNAKWSGKTRECDQIVKNGGVWLSDGPVPALVEIPSLKTEFADYSYVRLFDGPMRGKLVAVERRAVGTEKVVLLLDVYKQKPATTSPAVKPILLSPEDRQKEAARQAKLAKEREDDLPLFGVPTSVGGAPKTVQVKGYWRTQNGKRVYVQPHSRSRPSR